jgi:hypothetical protein
VNYNNLIGGIVIAAGFRDAPLGMVGPSVRDYDPALFTSPNGIFKGTWTSSDAQPLTPALVSDLFDRKIYFEIATQEFPTGEIRGQVQVVPEPATVWLALLGAAGIALSGLTRRRTARQAGRFR